MVEFEFKPTKIAKVEELSDFEDEYVYDIGISDSTRPYFFANDLLVHNSSYFSVVCMKDHPSYRNFDWSIDNVIQLYDLIAEEANASFPAFMQQTFSTIQRRGSLIKAGRELVASRGLFIRKKKYAVLMVDKEGRRLDVDGKPGKLKPMGLDLKRADTPRFMQQFLEKLLMALLSGQSQEEMYAAIREFRRAFKQRPPWEKGSPKKAGKFSEYSTKLENANSKGQTLKALHSKERLRINMPGHIRASLNWNLLCELNHDQYTTRITDSVRIIVCKLKSNIYGMTSIAYPIDETHLPAWFRALPFDDAAMEDVIIDKKVLNLCGVLGWDLTDTKEKAGSEFFSF